VPGQPLVLSNLGLSYVLSKELPKAEETLRRAHGLAPTDPRVRANLALVVGLQGRYADAEKIVKADLSPAEAAANVTQLKQMLSRKEKESARAEAGMFREYIGDGDIVRQSQLPLNPMKEIQGDSEGDWRG